MNKTLYAAYILFGSLGLALSVLVMVSMICRWNPTVPLSALWGAAAVGLSFILVSANRILYLHAAQKIIGNGKPLTRGLTIGNNRFGKAAVSIEDVGTFCLDDWHNVYNDKSREILAGAHSGEVFIDPSDHLPVAIKVENQTFLLAGQTHLLNEAHRAPAALGLGMGWVPLVVLIVGWYSAAAVEYSKAGFHDSAVGALVWIAMALLYFLPFIVGSMCRCRGGELNFILNLFLGWTGVAWLFVCWRVWKDLSIRKDI